MTDDQMKPGVALLAQALAPPPPACDLPSRVTRTRDPVALTLAGQAARFTTAKAAAGPGALTLPLRIGDHGARLDLPRDLAVWALGTRGLSLPRDADQLALLLEFACQDLAESIEAALGLTLRVGGTPGATPLAVGVALDLDGRTYRLCLHLDTELAGHLADHLDRHAPGEPPADLMQTPVATALQIGQQFLALDDIATLQPGDVVMLEPGPALLVAGDAAAAAIRIGTAGPVVQSDLLPLPQPEPRAGTRLSFIAGRARMTLAQLDALEPGASLPVAAFDGAGLDIHAGDRLLGRGETVTLGAGTGVRILHLFADSQ